MVHGPVPDWFKKMIAGITNKEIPFDTKPAYSKLRVVVNNRDDDKYGTSPANLMSKYLQLPSRREFSGQMIDSRDHEGLALLQPATLPLKHLELRGSRINSGPCFLLSPALKRSCMN